MRDLGVFLEYRGFNGSVSWNEVNNRYFGKIMGISRFVAYNGKNYAELNYQFRDSVDLYMTSAHYHLQTPECNK